MTDPPSLRDSRLIRGKGQVKTGSPFSKPRRLRSTMRPRRLTLSLLDIYATVRASSDISFILCAH